MFEVYENADSYADRYMVIIDNPDRDLDGHKPFYDLSIDPHGGTAHGSQWSQTEVDNLHKRVATDYSNKGASYAYKRVGVGELPHKVQLAILLELETESNQ